MTSPVTPTPVTAGPPVPSIGDPEATFDSQLEAYHTWQKNNLQPEINTIAAQTYTNAVAAGERAAEAASSASAASSSASAASSSASAASNSAAAAAQAVASLPGGTINDTTPSATNTYSSNKINTLLNDKQAKITASGLLKGDGLGGVTTAQSGTDIKTVNGESLLGAGNILAGASVGYETRSSNTALAPADKGKLIDLTGGGWTQTLQAAATLGAGWYCYLRYADASLADTWNGTFTTDTLWTKGSGWTISGGKANASSANTSLTSTASPLVVGRRYRFTVTVTSSGGTLYLYAGTASKYFSTGGTYVFELTCTSNTSLYFSTGAFTGSVDDLKIVDLDGLSIDPNASELIDGVTVGTLRVGQTVMIVCTGTAFVCQALHTNTLTEFISSGTSWVCPLGVRSVEVTLVGGGNAAPDAYREGAGGVTTIARQAVHPSKTYTYAVGAGGTYPSGTGGTTSFIENSATLQTSSAAPINGYLVGGYRTPDSTGSSLGGPSFGGGMGYGRGGSPGGAGSAGGIILRY